jgi:hypothetical protein
MRSKCTIPDCETIALCRGWCSRHYQRWAKYGDPNWVTSIWRTDCTDDPVERFWKRVQKTESCWLWLAGHNGDDGYGIFRVHGRPVLAHRFAYELLVGPIPAGMELDHLCRVRHCVNPDDLEPVTTRENILRGFGRGAIQARRTHCPRGHPYDVVYKNGRRGCARCNRARNHRKG